MATIRWCPIFPKWDSYQPLCIPAHGCFRNAGRFQRQASCQGPGHRDHWSLLGQRHRNSEACGCCWPPGLGWKWMKHMEHWNHWKSLEIIENHWNHWNRLVCNSLEICWMMLNVSCWNHFHRVHLCRRITSSCWRWHTWRNPAAFKEVRYFRLIKFIPIFLSKASTAHLQDSLLFFPFHLF